MTTLYDGINTIEPLLVQGYDVERASRTIKHHVIGKAGFDYSLAPAGPRSGTLDLLFDDEADAKRAADLHSVPAVWTLTDQDRPTIGMQYVVDEGFIGTVLEDETRNLWTVPVPFSEVIS